MANNYAEVLADIINKAKNEGNAEVTIHLVFTDNDETQKTEETEQKISRVNEKLESLKEKYNQVKQTAAEGRVFGWDQKDVSSDETTDDEPTFTYKEFLSILEDRIDEIESTVVNINENIETMMVGIPKSFDLLEKNIGCNSDVTIKKKGADKIIKAIETQTRRQHEAQLARYNDLKTFLTEIKQIGLANATSLNRLNNQLKMALNTKYGLSENVCANIENPSGDKTTQEMIKDIYNMLLLSKGSTEESSEKLSNLIKMVSANQEAASQAYQTVLKDIYGRQDEIEKKVDDLTAAVRECIDTLKDSQVTAELASFEPEEPEKKKPAKKSTTIKKTTAKK